MNIEELNRRLTALTPSERAYRDGATYDWQANNEFYTEDGRSIFRMSDSVFHNAANIPFDSLNFDGTRAATSPAQVHSLAGQLMLRRNSRFNPVPEHVHSYMEMSYVYAGTCPQQVNGADVLLKENQVLLLDSNCPHAIGALGQGDIMISIVVSKSYLQQLLEGSTATNSLVAQFLLNVLNEQTDHRRYVRFHSQGSRRVRRFFQELMCEYLDPSPNADEIVLHLLQLILAELMNVYEADWTRREERDLSRRVAVIPIIRYIEQNYLVCTQESVAERFFISPNYVSTLLKKHTGMTYRQMVQAQKLGHAAQLLRSTDLPVAEVAHASGYENQSFFYRKFRERYGCLPAEYREQSR